MTAFSSSSAEAAALDSNIMIPQEQAHRFLDNVLPGTTDGGGLQVSVHLYGIFLAAGVALLAVIACVVAHLRYRRATEQVDAALAEQQAAARQRHVQKEQERQAERKAWYTQYLLQFTMVSGVYNWESLLLIILRHCTKQAKWMTHTSLTRHYAFFPPPQTVRKEDFSRTTKHQTITTKQTTSGDDDDNSDDDLKEVDIELGEASSGASTEDHEDSAGEETCLQIPGRSQVVDIHCAICLGEYEVGDKVVYSGLQKCIHAFHEECILPWIASKGRIHCPMCREKFVPPAPKRSSKDNAEKESNNSESDDLQESSQHSGVTGPFSDDSSSSDNDDDLQDIGGAARTSTDDTDDNGVPTSIEV
jgi:hypothetical protein